MKTLLYMLLGLCFYGIGFGCFGIVAVGLQLASLLLLVEVGIAVAGLWCVARMLADEYR